MENDIIYDIWLQSCFGVNNPRFAHALELFGSAKDIYMAEANEYTLCGIFTEREIQKLSNKSLQYAEKTAGSCEALGINPVSFVDPLYPDRLKKISGPPVMLYIKGKMPFEDSPFVSVFGTRYPSDGSGLVARSFARGLASNGVVVVSGGAIGIDQFAHKGAMEAGGSTLCVAGCGIDLFPESGRNEVKNDILKKGTVVSEYPPGYPPTRYTFPMRDRIITGLSDCCVIVQSGTGSGSLIAAKYAVKQGRKLFVVPGPAFNERYLGNNLLLKAGFSAVLDHEDVLSWLDETRLISDEKPNPPLSQELERQLSIKPENIKSRSRSESSFSDPPGYRMSLDLKNNIDSLLNTQNDDIIPSITKEEIRDNGKHFTRDISDGLMKDYLRKEKMPVMTEAVKTTVGNRIPEEDSSDALEDPEEPTHYKAVVDRSFIEENDKSPKDGVGEIISDIRGSMDFASKEYKDFVMDEMKYKKLGKESPYVTLDREFLECLFLPKKEAFDKISELLGDPGLKLDESGSRDQFYEKTYKGAEKNKSAVKADIPGSSAKKKKPRNGKKSEQNTPLIEREKEIEKLSEPIKKEKNKEILSERLTEDAVSVYDTFSDTSLSTDEIILAAGLPTGRVFVAITELCSAGYIRSVPGGKYIKTK